MYVNEQAFAIPELSPPPARNGISEEELLRHVAARGDLGSLGKIAVSRYAQRSGAPHALTFEGCSPTGRPYRVVRRSRANGGSIVTVSDISAEKRARAVLERSHRRLEEINAKMKHRAFHDPLTGLPNRRFLDDVLPKLLARCRRVDERCAVLHLDLDHFKHVNDRFGHLAGDELLRLVAERLTASLRSDDVVARIGGDEFVIVGSHRGKASDIAGLAIRVIEALGEPFDLADAQVRIGGSIGIALSDGGEATPVALLKEADVALYRAKQGGRGRYEFFSEALQQEADERRVIIEAVSAAVHRRRLSTLFAPRADLRTGQIAGLSLIACFDGTLGPWRTPRSRRNDLLASGKASDIDLFVIEQAAEAREAAWREGFDCLQLIVPLAHSTKIEAPVFEEIERTGIGAFGGQFVFALPHEVYSEFAPDHLVEATRALTSKGVRFQIDCVGARFGGAGRLSERKPAVFRVAESVMQRFNVGPDARALIAAITSAAAVLGVSVSAPMVELRESFGMLAELGCDYVEGPAVGSPVDFDAALALTSPTHSSA